MSSLENLFKVLKIEVEDRGADYWACCPFHEEKTPSWMMNADSGKWRCFGCDEYGDEFDLVQRILKVSFGYAKKFVAEILGDRGPLPTQVNLVVQTPNQSDFSLPLSLGGGPLESWPTIIRRYVESRGIMPHQVAKWGLRYATSGRLIGRVVIPIEDIKGQLLSYTGRAFTDVEGNKYKRPNENPKKGSVENSKAGAVFGERYWPSKRGDSTIIVGEGEINGLVFDRIAPEFSFGALGGSKVDMLQMVKIGAFGRIVIAQDADEAGSKIARQLYQAYAQRCTVEVLKFPSGEDAQSVGDKEAKRLLWECTSVAKGQS